MQALGMIETKGMLASIEALDTMLKAADVSFFEKQKVGGGRVTVLVTGDVAAVKAAVDAAVTAVKRIQEDGLLSCHVIPRPHDETMGLFETGADAGMTESETAEDTKNSGREEPEKNESLKTVAPETEVPETKVSNIETPVKEPVSKEKTETKEKTEAKGSKKNKTE